MVNKSVCDETSATMLSNSAVEWVVEPTYSNVGTLYTTEFINHRGPPMLWKLIFEERKK